MCCKYVLGQLSEYSSKPLPIYVNCWQHDSRQAVLSLISQKAGEVLPRRGISGEEVFSRTLEALHQAKRVPVIVLDEADRLFWGGQDKLLYDLTRTWETSQVHSCVILVTNDSDLLARADARVRSSLVGRTVEFRPYSPVQLKQILVERSQIALAPGVCSPEVIALCAAFGAKAGGDARVALQALWLSARAAVEHAESQITLQDAKTAFLREPTSASVKRDRDAQFLEEPEKRVLELLKAKGPSMSLAEFYSQYEAQFGSSERAVRNYLRRLEFKCLLATESQDEAGGAKKIVRLL
jgi:cell division control protein 6